MYQMADITTAYQVIVPMNTEYQVLVVFIIQITRDELRLGVQSVFLNISPAKETDIICMVLGECWTLLS